MFGFFDVDDVVVYCVDWVDWYVIVVFVIGGLVVVWMVVVGDWFGYYVEFWVIVVECVFDGLFVE